MNFAKKIIKELSRHIDIRFFSKFVVLYVIIYYSTFVYIALADAKGLLYVPFLNHHFINYINPFENLIIYTSNYFSHILGLPSYVIKGTGTLYANSPILKINNGASVILSISCLGIGIMSFWMSFVIANNKEWKQKLLWCILGLITIFFLNALRITFLLLALQNNWVRIFKFIDHHTLFNIIAYTVVLGMIYFFDKGKSKSTKLNYTVNYKRTAVSATPN